MTPITTPTTHRCHRCLQVYRYPQEEGGIGRNCTTALTGVFGAAAGAVIPPFLAGCGAITSSAANSVVFPSSEIGLVVCLSLRCIWLTYSYCTVERPPEEAPLMLKNRTPTVTRMDDQNTTPS